LRLRDRERTDCEAQTGAELSRTLDSRSHTRNCEHIDTKGALALSFYNIREAARRGVERTACRLPGHKGGVPRCLANTTNGKQGARRRIHIKQTHIHNTSHEAASPSSVDLARPSNHLSIAHPRKTTRQCRHASHLLRHHTHQSASATIQALNTSQQGRVGVYLNLAYYGPGASNGSAAMERAGDGARETVDGAYGTNNGMHYRIMG
jgi:hypothetical protein